MTPKTLLPVVFALVLCAGLVAGGRRGAAAQSAGPASDLVYVDVSVLDANRRPVRDLTAADVSVLDDGQPATIAGMSLVTFAAAPGVPAAAGNVQALAHSDLWPRLVPPDVVRNDDIVDRRIAIVIDDTRIGGSGSSQDSWTVRSGLDIAREIVNRLGPGDSAAVFFAYMGRQQGFTSDRAKLLAAIDGFTLRTVEARGCAGEATPGGCVVDALQRVADALPQEPAPATRTVIAFITGPLGAPAALSGGTPPPDVAKLARTLQRASATVYAFGPVGAPIGGGGDAGRFAAETGGRAVVDTIPPAAQVAAMLDEISSFYRIALRPAATGGAYRPLTVRVARVGTDVRARSGYFTAGETGDVPSGATPLEQALLANTPATSVPVGAQVAVFAIPGRREAMVSVAANVTSRPVGGAADWQAEVAATAFDRDWQPRAAHRQTIEVTGRADRNPQVVDVLSAIELLPGRYELRVAAESGGRAGSVFIDVQVPEFAATPLSASDIVVSTAPQPYKAVPVLGDAIPVTPTTRRVFGRGETPEVFLRFYQGNRARLRNMPVALTITSATGDGVIQGSETILPSQFTEARSTDWRFNLPIDRLPPGEYLLTVEASLDDLRVARQIRFGVVQ